ncbi:branched-chain amino acid transport system permease protein [Thermosporothrix hazakensis]|jgi:branched-chain amino acid transport system permease protein|uniref:Branched-chain amino acid transport system permease protein n=2 Tax=Thermosporothrix TaxID=768650 RepID=A0A326U9V0_THEHA|nr:branched-chain amino acid ABC transporter permease [Thermosporothrix hazakensis]PZW31973.1 branched-chain amino acid transport system permease protein [Thermosporothrix hazakensis]BBH91556.1 branched-chain amino acid ABC transporter permease [Thermosporothrix sp. COM3]GCE49702.1 branched-chain amino acid ABC transporter permease [Thermosporothrix hazakensis]
MLVHIFQLIKEGIAQGSIYALIALGYTMVYGIIELINFAHGDIFMIGSMVSIAVLTLLGVTDQTQPNLLGLVGLFLVACICAMIVCAVLGVIIERIAYRPLRNAPRLAPLISAIGVSLILQDVGKLWNGINYIRFPQILDRVDYCIYPIRIDSVSPFHVTCLATPGESVTIDNITLLVLAISIVLMVFLQWLVSSTKVGKAMRAVAQDREAAALMGVNVDLIISVTFLIGAALAGAAGFIYGLKNGATIYSIGYQYGLVAFIAAVLGGIGNIRGAMLGGIVLGLIYNLVSLIPDSLKTGWGLPHGGAAWDRALIFVVLILILVFRPSGLLGQHTPEKV